jgi:hypothetical protein
MVEEMREWHEEGEGVGGIAGRSQFLEGRRVKSSTDERRLKNQELNDFRPEVLVSVARSTAVLTRIV